MTSTVKLIPVPEDLLDEVRNYLGGWRDYVERKIRSGHNHGKTPVIHYDGTVIHAEDELRQSDELYDRLQAILDEAQETRGCYSLPVRRPVLESLLAEIDRELDYLRKFAKYQDKKQMIFRRTDHGKEAEATFLDLEVERLDRLCREVREALEAPAMKETKND